MSFKSLTIVATAALSLFAGAAQSQVSAFANVGFEEAANSAGEVANGWQGNQQMPVRTSERAHSGSFSALLAIAPDPLGGGGSGLFQNSVDHGGLLAVDPANWGTTPTLSFWVSGNASVTGNFTYALRYLNSNGGILNGGSAQARTIFQSNVERPWMEVSLAGIAIPTDTSAVFVEYTLATGPSGPAVPCGVDNQTGAPLFCDWGTAKVYVDDVKLTLANPVDAVPEAGTLAMTLTGALLFGAAVRRRRSVGSGL